MTLLRLRYTCALLCGALTLAYGLSACSEEEPGTRLPENVIDIGFDGGTLGGCVQPVIPSDQPDISALSPPIFLLTGFAQQSTVGQAQAIPGQPIEAEVTVNAATRNLKVELVNAHNGDDVLFITEEQTAGNETLALLLFSENTTKGRYYMRITLCGFDCDDQQILFDVPRCSRERDPDEPCGINEPYERTVIEKGELTQVDSTCVDLGSTPRVGSGTIIIQ